MMVPAAVARRFVPQLHSPHIERARYDKKNKTKRKDRKKTTKVGIKGAKYSYSKTQIKLADIEKHI